MVYLRVYREVLTRVGTSGCITGDINPGGYLRVYNGWYIPGWCTSGCITGYIPGWCTSGCTGGTYPGGVPQGVQQWYIPGWYTSHTLGTTRRVLSLILWDNEARSIRFTVGFIFLTSLCGTAFCSGFLSLSRLLPVSLLASYSRSSRFTVGHPLTTRFTVGLTMSPGPPVPHNLPFLTFR